jgi:hypothetical protein
MDAAAVATSASHCAARGQPLHMSRRSLADGFFDDFRGYFEHPLDDSPCFPAFTGGAEVC